MATTIPTNGKEALHDERPRRNRAVHDYEYIQIQFDYYGMIVIKIQLHCIHSLVKNI